MIYYENVTNRRNVSPWTKLYGESET